MASGKIEPSHTVRLIRRISPRVDFVWGRVDHMAVEGMRMIGTTADPEKGTPRASIPTTRCDRSPTPQ